MKLEYIKLKIKNKIIIIISKISVLVGYGWIIFLLVNKLIQLILDLNKEPSFWHGLKKFWEIMNPFELAFSIQFWIFLILLLPGLGLIKYGEYLKTKLLKD
jgi:hypothetical protein